MSAIRVGLAGYGLGGRVFHAPLIRATPGLSIEAVFSPSARTREIAAQELGVPTFGGYGAFLASDIDVVVVATPHDTHAPLAMAASEAGKHVVVDKVMCLTLDEGRRMAAAAEGAARLLTVYQNRRWDGDFLTVRRLVSEGVLGDLLVVEARWTTPALSRRAEWRLKREHGGGMLLDLGAHLVDQLLLLGGPVRAVSCTKLWSDPSADVETYADCRLQFRSGLYAVLEVSAITPGRRARWFLRGGRAAYRKFGLDPQEGVLRSGQLPTAENTNPEPGAILRTRDGALQTEEVATQHGDWGAFYRNVRDAVRGEAPLAVRVDECLAGLAILLAAQRSAEQGGAFVAPDDIDGASADPR
jgi:scyllo-inositol 2-dehydrogenase (NADP+)